MRSAFVAIGVLVALFGFIPAAALGLALRVDSGSFNEIMSGVGLLGVIGVIGLLIVAGAFFV